jgi:peptidoglycan/LPS O-acetylase OafA/YrhL
MFQYYLNIPNLDDPYWTMIVEMIFYIFVLLLFYLGLLQYVVYIGTVLTIGIVMFVHFYWSEFSIQLFKGVPLLEFFPLFFAGIIFYKIMNERKGNFSHYLLIAVCLASQIFLFSYAGRSKEFISLTEYTIVLSAFFGLFLLFVNHRLGILISRPFLFIGKISFALYLTHQYIIVGHVLPFLLNRLRLNFWLSSVFICLPIALGIATAITYFIEIPYGKKMKQKLSAMVTKS